MAEPAWKTVERRICRALGGERKGVSGVGSDCTQSVPWSVEIKWTSKMFPAVLASWITQARRQAQRDMKPWLLIVAQKHSPRLTVTMEFKTLLALVEQARGGEGGVEGSVGQSADGHTAAIGDPEVGGWTRSPSARIVSDMSHTQTDPQTEPSQHPRDPGEEPEPIQPPVQDPDEDPDADDQ